MQNGTSRFRVGAIADLSVICNWEGLDCFFGKPGLAEPSVLSKRAAVRRFSILTSWRDLVGRCGNIGLMVRPKLCAGPTEDSSSGYLVGFGGLRRRELVRVLKSPGMNGDGKVVAGSEVHCEQ